MKQINTRKLLRWGAWMWLLVLLVLLGSGAARAQSGPFGNEWIIPGQPYYKIKITSDALYRLDYQYLTQAGLSGADPSRLQLWRRGKELAVYQGGTANTLDANTYLEFFGQRNDGQLDRGLYKTPTDQPHQLYSFYTDTAAYFLTYGGPTGPLGKRMAESQSAGGGTPQAWWLFTSARPQVRAYLDIPYSSTFLPWLEPGEGFFGGDVVGQYFASTDPLRAVLPTGPAPAPVIEVGLTGGTLVPHATEIIVQSPLNSSVYRSLGTVKYANRNNAVQRFTMLRSDIGKNGLITIDFSGPTGGSPASARDQFRVSYLKAVVPQATRWFNAGPQFFRNDSTLSAPATFEVDSIPNTARGYDVHDPWNVQRVTPAAAQTLGALGRRFVFPSATAAQSRRLLLADAAGALVPAAPRRVVFRNLNAKATFAIITHPRVYGVSRAPRLYAGYRASAAGGRYDTLVVTAPQLYDQFHYGERSWLALRHFGLWLANGNPANPNRYLLLLGKGIVPSEDKLNHTYRYRDVGEQGFDLVPTSSRAVSDNMLTADFRAGNYRAQLRTGRLTVVNEQQVLNYLNKLKEHEALGAAPWRKNILHLVGGADQTEADEFRATLDRSKVRAERPYFGGTVTTRETVSKLPTVVNIATELNAGLSLISYFGHGTNNIFLLDFGTPADASSGYTNAGKYPMLFLNGCGGNHTFTADYTRVEDWLFNVPNAGALGSLGEYGFSYSDRLEIAQDSMYRLLFNDAKYYGQPITAVHDEVVRRLQLTTFFKDDIGAEQLLATGWQGDPTLALYAPPKPDFVASSAALSITSASPPAEVTAASASFILNIGMSNPSKITREPVEVRVTRKYGSGRPDDVYTQTFRQASRRDTVYAFSIPNTTVNGVNVFGNNQFTVELDYANKVAELDETNNTATLSYTFLQGGVTVLSPPEFAIVPNRTPRLVAQTNDPNGPARLFNVELDTTAAFNSPLVQRTDVTAPLLVSWRPTLPVIAGRDSVVWFWRARFAAAAPGEDGRWATSSFRAIDNLSGWSQSHYAQLQRDGLKGASVASPNGRWAFDGPNTRAVITSARIGPAQEWKSLLHQVSKSNATGSFKLRVLGIDAAGNTKELNASVPSSRFSLAGISAADYPYLQLELSVADTNRVAPQLREWLVAYTGVPEGVVRRDLVPAATYDPAALLQQATGTGKLSFPVQFENVSALPFGTPLRVKTEVFDSNTNTQVASVVQTVTAPLLPDAILTQNVVIPLVGKYGNLSTKVTFNPLPTAPADPQALPELTHANNELNLLPFKVADASVPPVLDVAFDGRHILNGEIVSPRPVVSLQLTDTDRLRPLADAAAFTVYLQAGNAPATAVNVLGPDVTFRVETTPAGSTAYLEYHPGRANPLPDGVYTLRAQGRNAAAASAAAQEFQVKFTVVNASQITNVYPYPNPVTSKARFVFTVTGQELPRNMKIQIMTLTGRVVREIFMGELGNVHLGNNLTDFAWDGTDQYGDRLANGTYLYRVSLDDPDGKFSRRATSGDQAFKNDWGKLVLLR